MTERNVRIKELAGIKYPTYGSKHAMDGFAIADAFANKGSHIETSTIELDENDTIILPENDKRLYLRVQNIGSKLIYLQFGKEAAESGHGWKLGTDDDKIFDEALLVRQTVRAASTGGAKITYLAIYA